jgi:hypothetical protein
MEWIPQLFLTLILLYGVLFSKTPSQAYIVLIALTLIFLFLRYVKIEGPDSLLSEFVREFSLKNPAELKADELIVGCAVIVQVLRTIFLTFDLQEIVF